MFKRKKSSSAITTPASDSQHPRNPRVHRQSGILSITRPNPGLSNETKQANPPTSTPISHHRRFPSAPQPSAIQAQIDIDGDRIARGLVSPPIVDFTHFDDRFRGPRTGGHFDGLLAKTNVGIKPILKRNPHSSGKDMIPNPRPACSRKPDPRLIISALEGVVPDSLKKPADVFDVYDLLGMHQLDQLDFEERDIARGNSSHRGEMVVLGEPLRKASIYASTTVVLGGREHELPIIVVSCIEELYRTGIYQTNLFRTLPNRSRLLELINIFDSEQQRPGIIARSRLSSQPEPKNPGFGANTSLHLESTPDICALLSTYLSALPEPILLPTLFRPIWDWCGLENDQVQLKPFRRRISSVPLSRTYTDPTESTHIVIAQLVLHLLPSPHFSLLIYILAFFSQVALVHEENGVGIGDLARMFGGRIFGGGEGQSRRRKLSAEIALSDAHESRTEGEVMMSWFLKRWGPISEGLFDVIDVAKVEQQDRRRSLGELSEGPLDNVPNHSSGRDTPFRPPLEDGPRSSGDSPSSLRDEKIKPTGKTSGNNSSRNDPETEKSLDDDNETFNIPTATELDEESVYSGTALDERLLDVSMPTLLNQTFPINDVDDETPPSSQEKAHQHIVMLESKLEESKRTVAELSKEKLDLERRVQDLELALELERKRKKIRSGGGVGSSLDDEDEDEYRRMLEVAKKERDEALDLVREIRELMVKN